MFCRTCGNSLEGEAMNTLSVFSFFLEGITFSDMVLSCTDVKIEEDDNLPQQICEDCVEELQIAFTFRRKCRNTDERFKNSSPVTKNAVLHNDFEIVECNDYYQDDQEMDDINGDEIEKTSKPPEIPRTITRELQEVKNMLNEIEQKTSKADTNEKDKMSMLLKLEKSLQQTEALINSNVNENVSENENDIIEYTITTDIPGEEIETEYLVEFLTTDENTNSDTATTKDIKRKKLDLNYYSCCGCGEKFSTNNDLTEHIDCHKSDKVESDVGIAFECNLCFKPFDNEEALTEHKRLGFVLPKSFKMSAIVKNSTNFYELEETSESRCCGCKAIFKTPEELDKHSKEMHESFRSSVLSESRQYECDICFKCYTSALFLEQHKIAPYRVKKFKCEICNDAFISKHLLNAHEKLHLNIVYKCEACGKQFHNVNSFNTHTRKHKEAEYVCMTCGKISSTKQKHADHLTIHSDLMPFSCSLCNKKFKRRDLVRTHMRVHTGEKRYGCKYCEKVFAHWSDCKRHEMIHTKDYPYQCSTCKRQFSRKTHWQAHEANHLK